MVARLNGNFQSCVSMPTAQWGTFLSFAIWIMETSTEAKVDQGSEQRHEAL